MVYAIRTNQNAHFNLESASLNNNNIVIKIRLAVIFLS